MADEAHSSLSPSGRHRWGACPGSVRAEAPYPDTEGPAAIDGTRTHALLERLVKYEFIDKEGVCGSLPMWNAVITDEYGTYKVDPDRAARLNVAMEWIRNFVDENGGTVITEQRVFPDGLVGRADMHGSVDIQIVTKFVYPVFDYKDGMHPVNAVENPQLEMYALGVLAGLRPENYPKKFLLVICQPKLALKGLPVISTWEITPAELLARVPVVIAQAAATDDPNAPLVPGEAQCKYCKAKGTCRAIAQQAMQGIGAMFSPVTVSPVHDRLLDAIAAPALPSFLAAAVADTSAEAKYVAEFLRPPVPYSSAVQVEVLPPTGVPDMAHLLAARDPHKMDDAQLRQLMEAAPLVNQLLEGVKKEIERRLHAGQTVVGFKLVTGRGSRDWALPEDEMVKKLVGMGIPKTALYKQTFMTPPQAEKLVWDKKGEPMKLSDRQLKSMEQEYVAKKLGAPVVVPESDSRPAIVRDSSPLFSPVAALPAASVPSFLAAPAARPSFL